MPGPEASDTDDAAAELQFDRFRAMSAVERLQLAAELSVATVELATAGIRMVDPAISDADLRVELARRMHGPEVAELFRHAIAQNHE